jgi:nucleoside-diphosphate-sugar epimerase
VKILVTGGCGYVGSMLVPQLLADGHRVTVLDTMWLGDGGLPRDNEHLAVIKGDVRDEKVLRVACLYSDAVIWLASLSNNDECNKRTELSDAVNKDAVPAGLKIAREVGVKRFIYASSVAAYGSSDKDATEITTLKPSTRYGEAKAFCESKLLEDDKDISVVIARPASVCGASSAQRFDLTVNRMVHDAMRLGAVTVNGGAQKRSHIHMHDMIRAYRELLEAGDEYVSGQVFNFVAENQSVLETANIVADLTGAGVIVGPATDDRSYTVDGTKARKILGFTTSKTVKNAVRELKARFDGDKAGFTHYFDNAVTSWAPALG